MTIEARALKAGLGKTRRAVRAGVHVVVTSRGRAVAMLTRATCGIPGEWAVDRKLRRLALGGVVRPAAPGAIERFRAARIGGLTAQLLTDRG